METLMRQYVLNVIAELESSKNWAEVFVNRRMEFHRKFSMGLIFSTVHGADFFFNVIHCLDGAKWSLSGEYEENFRKVITHYQKSEKTT